MNGYEVGKEWLKVKQNIKYILALALKYFSWSGGLTAPSWRVFVNLKESMPLSAADKQFQMTTWLMAYA